jgi:hypothetical protein
MAECIEIFDEDHLGECARLLVSTFNAESWNDQYGP